MIDQAIVGEVEEDRLILVHVAWNVAGHWIMNEPPGVLISFCKTGKAMCMLSLGRSLLRVLRLCIAPWLFGGRSSYFAGNPESPLHGDDRLRRIVKSCRAG